MCLHCLLLVCIYSKYHNLTSLNMCFVFCHQIKEFRQEYTDCVKVGSPTNQTCADYLDSLTTNATVADRYCDCNIDIKLDEDFTVRRKPLNTND